MKKQYRPPESLMAIDHPKWLFDLLCSFQGSLDKRDVGKKLIGISQGKIESLKSKSIEMHLYVLTTLGFLESNKAGITTYRRSKLGDILCENYRDERKQDMFREMLRSILLRNAVFKPFFDRLISMIEKSVEENNQITYEDIKKAFVTKKGKEVGTARTLRSLGSFSDIIVDRKGPIGLSAAFTRRSKEPSEKEFLDELKRSFASLVSAKEEGKSLRTIYLEIWRLRDLVLARMGRTDSNFFDGRLRKLLDSPLGRRIHLYSGAPQWYPDRSSPGFEDKVFRYRGKIYAFISFD